MSNLFHSSPKEQMPAPEVSVQLMRWIMVPEAAEAMQGSLQTQFPNLLNYSQVVAQSVPEAALPAAPSETASQPPIITPVATVPIQIAQAESISPRYEGIPINQPSGEIDIKADRSQTTDHLTREERQARAQELLDAAYAYDENVPKSHNFGLEA